VLPVRRHQLAHIFLNSYFPQTSSVDTLYHPFAEGPHCPIAPSFGCDSRGSRSLRSTSSTAHLFTNSFPWCRALNFSRSTLPAFGFSSFRESGFNYPIRDKRASFFLLSVVEANPIKSTDNPSEDFFRIPPPPLFRRRICKAFHFASTNLSISVFRTGFQAKTRAFRKSRYIHHFQLPPHTSPHSRFRPLYEASSNFPDSPLGDKKSTQQLWFLRQRSVHSAPNIRIMLVNFQFGWYPQGLSLEDFPAAPLGFDPEPKTDRRQTTAPLCSATAAWSYSNTESGSKRTPPPCGNPCATLASASEMIRLWSRPTRLIRRPERSFHLYSAVIELLIVVREATA